MFDSKLEITDFEFYVCGEDYSFEIPLGDDTTLEAQIHLHTVNSGRDNYECIDYIEIASEHNVFDDEMEELEEILNENLNEIFRTAQVIN